MIGSASAAGQVMITNPALEALCRTAPLDESQPYLVYADWLQEMGDPRGAMLVALDQGETSAAAKRLRQKAVLFGFDHDEAVRDILAAPRDEAVYRAFAECLSENGLDDSRSMRRSMLEALRSWESAADVFDDLKLVQWMGWAGWTHAQQLASAFIADRLARLRGAGDARGVIVECIRLANAAQVEFQISEGDFDTLSQHLPEGATRHYVGSEQRSDEGAWIASDWCINPDPEEGGWL